MSKRSGTATLKRDEPIAEMKISDLETIRVMSDPLRLRIIQAMAADVDEPWTVKRLAANLKLPATKLYYHVNLLEKHGLIRVTGTAIVSGIVESRYAIAARRFEVDRAVFATTSADGGSAMAGLLTTILDTARDEILAGVASGTIVASEDAPDDPAKLNLSKGGVHLSLARAIEFRRQMESVLAAFASDNEPDGITLAVLLAIYPIEP